MWNSFKRLSLGWKVLIILLLLTFLILVPFSSGLSIPFLSSLIPRGLRYLIPVQSKWKKMTSPAVIAAIKEVSKINGLDPNWVCKMIWIESRFKTDALNSTTQASGLWQAIPKTAEALGINELRTYTGPVQIELFTRYLKFFNLQNKIDSAGELYLSVFYPAAVDKPDSFVFPNFVLQFNRGLDFNKDGQLTKRDILTYVNRTNP